MKTPPALKLVLDLGPLLIFFVANAWWGIFAATAAFMLAMVVGVVLGFAIERKVSPVPLITGALVLVFGGLTLALSDELFIKLKPTILYTLFAAVLLGGLAGGRLLIKYAFGQAFQLDEASWRTLTWRWSLFFLALALANEMVWRNFSTDTWVAFKVWGIFPLIVLFSLLQVPFVMRRQRTSDKSPPAT
ncbi:MAG: septation protein A [Alphaproteobacteria bacterium]